MNVLVTGAARRIGRGIALELARRGFAVGIHYHDLLNEAEEVDRACGGAALF
jgi:3-oxoacyl-[acyl-carrier protein] reductase/pteridine reductase